MPMSFSSQPILKALSRQRIYFGDSFKRGISVWLPRNQAVYRRYPACRRGQELSASAALPFAAFISAL